MVLFIVDTIISPSLSDLYVFLMPGHSVFFLGAHTGPYLLPYNTRRKINAVRELRDRLIVHTPPLLVSLLFLRILGI